MRHNGGMKQLTIVVKPFRAEAVLQAVAELGVTACVVREAKGYSRQKGYLNRYVGSEYSMAFLPKVEISVCVSDERAGEVAERITKVARTGRIGDGKIFVLDTAWPEPLEF
jgi:nitrogen regulatory protein PII